VNDQEILLNKIKAAKERLGVLEVQLASFGPLYAPAHMVIEIDQTKDEIAKLQAELNGSPPPINSNSQPPVFNLHGPVTQNFDVKTNGGSTMSYNFNNINNSNIVIGSTGVQQAISAIPAASDAAKDELNSLVGKLLEELKKASPDQLEDAKTVEERTDALVKEASKAKVDKDEVKDRGNSLLRAAQNVAGVLPAVIGIATQVVAKIGSIVG